MIKLLVVEKDNYIYSLKDEKGKKYILNIEFMDIDKKVSINDIIYIDEGIIKENNFYTFGSPDKEQYGKKEDNIEEKDILILEQDNKKIYLQRYYG